MIAADHDHSDAVAKIDEALSTTTTRELVSVEEVSDLLLDLRQLLTLEAAHADPEE